MVVSTRVSDFSGCLYQLYHQPFDDTMDLSVKRVGFHSNKTNGRKAGDRLLARAFRIGASYFRGAI
jgi:hypothetical protein